MKITIKREHDIDGRYAFLYVGDKYCGFVSATVSDHPWGFCVEALGPKCIAEQETNPQVGKGPLVIPTGDYKIFGPVSSLSERFSRKTSCIKRATPYFKEAIVWVKNRIKESEVG